MQTLLIALGALILYLIAYHTYGKWLARKIFKLDPNAKVPSIELNDDQDFVPTERGVVFGHHFTSIAGTGPIVGPALAVMWGWVPALIWVLVGSILIGAVHDFGALVVSLRNRGQTVGDIAARLINKRVRKLFLFILFMALTIVLAIFGLVIAAVFRMYPAAIIPCIIQIPIAIVIGLYLHRKGINILFPSIIALAIMYLTVIYGDTGFLHDINGYLASLPIIDWVVILLVYSYIASVLPVWTLLQPRDYINSLQLISALALVVVGLFVAAIFGGAPVSSDAARSALDIGAPAFRLDALGAPPIWPFLFITIACGACSGFHCLVSSGTSSKQLKCETDAQFVGYGSMLTEGFLATLVILACVAGLSMGVVPDLKKVTLPAGEATPTQDSTAQLAIIHPSKNTAQAIYQADNQLHIAPLDFKIDDQSKVSYMLAGQPLILDAKTKQFPLTTQQQAALTSSRVATPGQIDKDTAIWVSKSSAAVMLERTAYNSRYYSWHSSQGLPEKVGAFVDGSANFLKALGIPAGAAIALMGVFVASFAGTTLDTACRLQRYVVQELAGSFSSNDNSASNPHGGNPLGFLTNKHAATIFAIVIAAGIAALPKPGAELSMATSGTGGLILWPLFGATNQLLAGLAFLVITFFLWRRNTPLWFIAVPMLFMLIMPAWAMVSQIPTWVSAENPNYVVIVIAIATLLLEVWMMVEALLIWPKVKGVLEEALPPLGSKQT